VTHLAPASRAQRQQATAASGLSDLVPCGHVPFGRGHARKHAEGAPHPYPLDEEPVSGNLRFVAAYRSNGLTALGDPTRRAIFEHLADAPRAVGELARELPVSRPAVSQHLKVLKDAGLVIDRRAGTRHIYQLDPNGVSELRAYFDRFWSQALAAFKAAAEQPTKKEVK
jgi:DNA-binding transcriptional ArsR family regulator